MKENIDTAIQAVTEGRYCFRFFFLQHYTIDTTNPENIDTVIQGKVLFSFFVPFFLQHVHDRHSSPRVIATSGT